MHKTSGAVAHPDIEPNASTREWAVEWGLRSVAILAYLVAMSNLAGAWLADSSRWTLLVLLLTEGYTLALVVLARRAVRRDARLTTLLVQLYVGLGYALLATKQTTALLPELYSVAIQLTGTACTVVAKVMLGRRFGVLPAYRGAVVTAGPYARVRHPMYFGYVVEAAGLLLANFSWRNLMVELAMFVALWLRVKREEAVLTAADPTYLAYRERVRWRVIPLIW